MKLIEQWQGTESRLTLFGDIPEETASPLRSGIAAGSPLGRGAPAFLLDSGTRSRYNSPITARRSRDLFRASAAKPLIGYVINPAGNGNGKPAQKQV